MTMSWVVEVSFQVPSGFSLAEYWVAVKWRLPSRSIQPISWVSWEVKVWLASSQARWRMR
jgi:hypothetical protein